ncbi:acyltransferase [Ceratobasidium sp. AG-Ba]|nr:acyltransferase [Ceratobasidium sp. AG-Ba]
MNIGPLLTIGAIGIGSKALLNTISASVTIKGLHHLLEALEETNRVGRGIITVSNHISVTSCSLIHRVHRWFFRNGQVIETVRGGGVHQPAVDLAVEKLNAGAWIHIFPEGKVNQESCVPGGKLLRFKWGVGRMIMSTTKTPVIIPMHITGLHKVMPEPRRFKFIPRPGHHVCITFGDPVDLTRETDNLVQRWRQTRPTLNGVDSSKPVHEAVSNLGGEVDTARLSGGIRKKAMEDLKDIDWSDEERARVDIVALLQRGVADLALAHQA